MVTSSLAALVMALSAATSPAHEEATASVCQAAASQPAIVTARQRMEADKENPDAHFKLAESWSNIGCFSDAVHVLQVAESLFPRNEEVRSRLTVARSMVNEQTYFENLDRAAQAAKSSRATFRCTKLNDLQACDEALTTNPNDIELVMAKAEALLQSKRPAEAVRVLRRAGINGRSKDIVAAKLAQAEGQRQAALLACETGFGDAALQACEGAWLAGANDELRILKRRGALLESAKQPAAALDAYVAASQLPGSDPTVDRAIVSLSDNSGRSDAQFSKARAAALARLGRVASAPPASKPSPRHSTDLPVAATPLIKADPPRQFSNTAAPTRSN